MTDILGRMGDLFGLGKDALIELLAGVIDALGQGTEFTGAQIERLGELQQKLADIVRGAEASDSGSA